MLHICDKQGTITLKLALFWTVKSKFKKNQTNKNILAGSHHMTDPNNNIIQQNCNNKLYTKWLINSSKLKRIIRLFLKFLYWIETTILFWKWQQFKDFTCNFKNVKIIRAFTTTQLRAKFELIGIKNILK